MSKMKKIAKWLVIVLVAAIVIFAIVFKVFTSNYYKADEQEIASITGALESEVNAYSDNNGSAFIPENQDVKAVIVFYPGGKVEYTAYTGLMYELASRGYLCLLPRMPENLAFLRVNAVDVLTANYQSEKNLVRDVDWYLAGHSLGGVAACSYLSEIKSDPGKAEFNYAGIILCASFPAVDLSSYDLRLLSIYGSNDTVLRSEKYEESKIYWPADSEEYVIDGGIHSYFANYGIQDGDGNPTITNEDQLKLTAEKIASWIK